MTSPDLVSHLLSNSSALSFIADNLSLSAAHILSASVGNNSEVIFFLSMISLLIRADFLS